MSEAETDEWQSLNVVMKYLNEYIRKYVNT